MLFRVKILPIICILVMLLAPPHHADVTTDNVQQFYKGMEKFGVRLFAELAEEYPHKNIVFSPFSIQTCIAMTRMGAENETALEIDQVLGLSSQKTQDLADNYHTILAQYKDSAVLKMANKIYAMTGYAVQDEFNALLEKQFYSSVDALNFAKNEAAAQTINSWVEGETNKLIKNLVNPQLLDENTRLVLVNAIYFKGNWVHQFPEERTREEDFYLDETTTTKVQMMHLKQNFMYADLPELNAAVLEMPYKDSNLVMWVILPNSRTGLKELEYKLKDTSLADIAKRMSSTKVIVAMPKFKAEFQTELSKPLTKMGLKRMFTSDAEFGKMLKSGEGLQVSSVIHKAFIEVNERGTEAAAATGMLIRKKRSLTDLTEIKEFNIEHPFLFKILHKFRDDTSTPYSSLILFAGKIENIHQNILSTETNFTELKDEL